MGASVRIQKATFVVKWESRPDRVAGICGNHESNSGVRLAIASFTDPNEQHRAIALASESGMQLQSLRLKPGFFCLSGGTPEGVP